MAADQDLEDEDEFDDEAEPEDEAVDELEGDLANVDVVELEETEETDEETEDPEAGDGGGAVGEDDETAEALDELEAEELELLEDEASESLLVDEVAELRAIRREELTMNVEAHAIRGDEFVCQSCFMVKRLSQLANPRKRFCRDCAS